MKTTRIWSLACVAGAVVLAGASSQAAEAAGPANEAVVQKTAFLCWPFGCSTGYNAGYNTGYTQRQGVCCSPAGGCRPCGQGTASPYGVYGSGYSSYGTYNPPVMNVPVYTVPAYQGYGGGYPVNGYGAGIYGAGSYGVGGYGGYPAGGFNAPIGGSLPSSGLYGASYGSGTSYGTNPNSPYFP